MLTYEPEQLAVSVIVLAELYVGAYRSQNPTANLELVERLRDLFAVIGLDDAVARQYGIVRSHLMALGTPIGGNDLLIAATALAHDLTVVTHNTGEFGRVPGLRVEDWF